MELSAFIKKGLSFQNSPSPSPSNKKLWGLHVFLVKRKIWWNRVVGFKKVGNLSLVLKKTSTFESYLSLSECWCLFCFRTRYLSEFYLFRMEKLMLFDPVNWYVTSTSQWCLNRQEIVELFKVNFWLFIECNKDSSCEPKTGGFNIYLYRYVILLVFSVCAVCLCLFGWYQRKVLAKKHVICET